MISHTYRWPLTFLVNKVFWTFCHFGKLYIVANSTSGHKAKLIHCTLLAIVIVPFWNTFQQIALFRCTKQCRYCRLTPREQLSKLYRGDNKLQIDEMMVMFVSTWPTRCNLSLICFYLLRNKTEKLAFLPASTGRTNTLYISGQCT